MSPYFSLPLACVFAGQCVLIAVAFTAVILVLTERQRAEYAQAIDSKIFLRQSNANQSVLLPFLVRETIFRQTLRKVLGRPELYIVNDNSTITSMKPFFEECYLSVFGDKLITNFAQFGRSDSFYHSNGDVYWSASGASEDLWLVVVKNGTGVFSPQTSYPLAFNVVRSVPYDVTYDPMINNRVARTVTWMRPRPFMNPLTSTVSFGITIAAPLRFDTLTNEVTNSLIMSVRIDIVRHLIIENLLSISTLALLVDVVREDVWVSTDTSFPSYARDVNDPLNPGSSWTLTTLPNKRQVAQYRTMATICPHASCSHATKEIASDIISIINIRTFDSGLDLHLMQSTPRRVFFEISDRDRAVGIAIGVLAASLVIVISIMVSLAIHRPLSRLQLGMASAAVMRNEEAGNANGSLSFLSEVNAIQQSFLAMNSKLMAARPFMPQHLLLDSEESGEEEDCEVIQIGGDYGGSDDEKSGAQTPTNKCGDATFFPEDSDQMSHGSRQTSGMISLRPPLSPCIVRNSFPSANVSPTTQSIARIAYVAESNNAHARTPRKRDITIALEKGLDGSTSVGTTNEPETPKKKFRARTRRPASTAVSDTSNSDVCKLAPTSKHQSLASRRVGILIVNLRGFHVLAGGSSAANCSAVVRELCALVESSASAERGIVDAFHGDHFTITFNVARVIGNAGRSASLVATRLVRDVKRNAILNAQSASRKEPCGLEESLFQQLLAFHASANCSKKSSVDQICNFSMGLSVGRAVVGNMGSETIKKLCVIGSVFSEAVALERLSKSIGQECCFLEKCLDGIENVAYSFLVGKLNTVGKYERARVLMEHISSFREDYPHQKARVASHQRTNSELAATDEWMYELTLRNESNPFQLPNEAMEAMITGELQLAKEKMNLWITRNVSENAFKKPLESTNLPPSDGCLLLGCVTQKVQWAVSWAMNHLLMGNVGLEATRFSEEDLSHLRVGHAGGCQNDKQLCTYER